MTAVFLKLVNSEFSGEEADKIEFASIVGMALDNIKGGNYHLEGIYTCYIPLYAFRVNESNFIVSDSMSREKNKLTISRLPEMTEVKAILKDETLKMQEKYNKIENLLLSKNIEEVEVSGILGKREIGALAKLITHHRANRADNRYKQLSPVITREEVKNQLNTLKKYTLSESEVENRIDTFLAELEKAFQGEIDNLRKRRAAVEKDYDAKIAQKKAEIKQKLAELKAEEKEELNRIDAKVAADQKKLINGVKSDSLWGRLKSDINKLNENYSQLLSKVNNAKTGDDLDWVIRQLEIMQEEIHSFGAGVSTALTEAKNRQLEYDDIAHQGEVDKRNIKERLDTIREEENIRHISLENEKEQKLKEIDAELKNAVSLLKSIGKKKKDLKKQIMANYEMSSTYTISADVLNVENTVSDTTINVPVAIAKYKVKNQFQFNIIPPFEIPENMSKIKNLVLRGENKNIGFDCIAIDALEKIRANLSYQLETNQNLQGEILGNNVLENGDISKFSAGINLLEEKKKYKDKNSDKLFAQSRKYLT